MWHWFWCHPKQPWSCDHRNGWRSFSHTFPNKCGSMLGFHNTILRRNCIQHLGFSIFSTWSLWGMDGAWSGTWSTETTSSSTDSLLCTRWAWWATGPRWCLFPRWDSTWLGTPRAETKTLIQFREKKQGLRSVQTSRCWCEWFELWLTDDRCEWWCIHSMV